MSVLPSPFGVRAGAESGTRPRSRVTVTGMSIVASRPAVALRDDTHRVRAVGQRAPSKTTVRAPGAPPGARLELGDGRRRLASTTLTVTFASTVERERDVVVSAWPSPFGEIVAGDAVALVELERTLQRSRRRRPRPPSRPVSRCATACPP